MHHWGGGCWLVPQIHKVPTWHPQSVHSNRKQHINSAAGYWSAFHAVLHTAYRDRKIKENPNRFLDRIKSIPTMREIWAKKNWYSLPKRPTRKTFWKKRSFSAASQMLHQIVINYKSKKLHTNKKGIDNDLETNEFHILLILSNRKAFG